MPHTTRLLTRAAVLALVLAGCSGTDDKTGDSVVPTCTGPVANAGADGSGSPGGAVGLDGSASTVCDTATVSYTWSVESVPVDSTVDTGDLDLTDPSKPSFTPDIPGTYVASLTVTDSSGVVSAPDLVIIEVSAGSQKPVADCGGNKVSGIGERVDFDGTGSADPEGAALTYQWSLASVPSCSALQSTSLYNANTATPSMVPDCASVFLVALVVSDGEQWSDPVQCSVSVGSDNQAPIAEAGNSGNLSPCTEQQYELDGYGSYDPEGQPLTYSWTLISAPGRSSSTNASFDDRTVPNPIFTWDVTGEYTFELRVNDGVNESAPDLVVLNFQDASGNSVPIANAGSDQTISRDADCSTASYVFTCEDCAADDVTLNGTGSADPVDGDDLSFQWSDSSRELSIASPTSAITTVYTPTVTGEYGTTTTRTWDVLLNVSDCADSDTDTVRITYNCTGVYSH